MISGSVTDLHPGLYGERPRVRLNTPNPARDAREIRVTRAALESSLPLLGICGGAQLMNIALGGSLYQDLEADGAAGRSHWGVQHGIETRPGTLARRILGRGGIVSSEHHQAARRIGRGLRGTSRSDDSIFESIELGGGRFALGLQWHPEHDESELAGRRIGDALLAAASEHAADRGAGREPGSTLRTCGERTRPGCAASPSGTRRASRRAPCSRPTTGGELIAAISIGKRARRSPTPSADRRCGRAAAPPPRADQERGLRPPSPGYQSRTAAGAGRAGEARLGAELGAGCGECSP